MLEDYIKENWDSCVRYVPEDKGALIGLPKPYIVPSPDGELQEIYYWDTYFTCKGLILTGRAELAKDCTDDMLFLVDKYGFMPNGNRTYYLSQSQPPFLSLMVMDIFEVYKDKEWLKKACETLKKEYNFWMTKRITETGLNKYMANKDSIGDADKHYESICKRLGCRVECENHFEFAENFLSDCESGWDFNPRGEMKQKQFVYADLNALLYIYEKNFAKMSEILELGEEEKWKNAAAKRKKLMNEYLWNGCAFMDYNFIEKRHSSVFSVASFYPLFAGAADKEQAEKTVENLKKLESGFGVAACAKNPSPAVYQWDWPTGWAPLQYIMIKALDNYGFKTEARRIAEKYVKVTESLFEKTGRLWEKYNVETGGTDVKGYASRIMLGWSAGVYIFAKRFIEKS